MNTKGEYLLTGHFWGKIAIIVSLGCFVSISSAEAAVTVRSLRGTVEVLLKNEGTWKPASEAMELNVGDQILTGKGSSVDLLCEDGSELHIEEETQLAISELEFSMAERTRVSRFKLFWGALTAKAATFVFQNNTFEIETDTVVAGVKFSSMRIIAKQAETLEDKPHTKILPIEGEFEMRQIGEGITNIECLLEAAPGGIVFSMGSNAVVELKVDQTRENEKIAVKSNVALQDMWTILSDERNLLHVENAANAPVVLMGFQEHSIKVEQDSAVEFGFPFGQAEQEIGVGADGIDVLFVFRQTSEVLEDRFYILADKGIIEVNGQKLPPGSSVVFPIEGREVPVVPSAPDAPKPEGAGAPTPTPTATATPTPIPTEEPEEEPEEEPTPTPTPKPTPLPREPAPSIGSPIVP